MKGYISNPSKEQVQQWLDKYPKLKYIMSESGEKVIYLKPFSAIGVLFRKLYQEINFHMVGNDAIGAGDKMLKNLALGGHPDFQNVDGADYTHACKESIRFFPQPEMSSGNVSDLLNNTTSAQKTKKNRT